MTQQPQKEEWEEAFDKLWQDKFAKQDGYEATAANSNMYWLASPNDVKSFIRSLLIQAKEEGKKEEREKQKKKTNNLKHTRGSHSDDFSDTEPCYCDEEK